MEKQELRKVRRGLRTSGATLNAPTSNHKGARKRRRRAKIENLLEKDNNKKFLNLAKEIDIQVQGAQSVPNKLDPKRNTPRHIIIKLPEVKDKGENLKSSKRKGESYLHKRSHNIVS